MNRENKILLVIAGLMIIMGGLFIKIYAPGSTNSSHQADLSANSISTQISPEVHESHTSILIVGDIMLDRDMRRRINQDGFDTIFAGVHDLVSGADVAIGNLEGPFTDNPSKTINPKNKQLIFTFDPELAPKLADLGFDVLGLANNHTENFGRAGLISTREMIKSAGMEYYGEPNNQSEISLQITKNDIHIGLVGFNEFSYTGIDKVLAEIDRLRPDVDILIVSPHWGVEYQTSPTTLMQTLAQKFIDHGADIVIGAHPHVVGEIARYKGKKIFYSLGNFSFDQYFSFDTMNGLAVLVDVKKNDDNISFNTKLIPIVSDRTGIRPGRGN